MRRGGGAAERRGRCTGDVQGWRRGRSVGGAAEEAWEEVWEMHRRRMAGDAQEICGRGVRRHGGSAQMGTQEGGGKARERRTKTEKGGLAGSRPTPSIFGMYK